VTRRSAIIFAVLVTACLAAITANLFVLHERTKPKQPADFPSVQELKQVWPEGYQMFRLGGITSEKFVAEAWRRQQESKP